MATEAEKEAAIAQEKIVAQLMERFDKDNDGEYSAKEVRVLARELYGELKEHGKTDMSKGDVSTPVRGLSPPSPSPPGASDRFRGIERLLEKCDSNKDGKYDREEVKVLVVDYYNECDEIDKLLIHYDKDNNGRYSKGEVRSIAQDLYEARKNRAGEGTQPVKDKFAVFEKILLPYDKNGDGIFDKNEVIGILNDLDGSRSAKTSKRARRATPWAGKGTSRSCCVM
jgi:Ca2+-binding EF-hand superfamily protein